MRVTFLIAALILCTHSPRIYSCEVLRGEDHTSIVLCSGIYDVQVVKDRLAFVGADFSAYLLDSSGRIDAAAYSLTGFESSLYDIGETEFPFKLEIARADSDSDVSLLRLLLGQFYKTTVLDLWSWETGHRLASYSFNGSPSEFDIDQSRGLLAMSTLINGSSRVLVGRVSESGESVLNPVPSFPLELAFQDSLIYLLGHSRVDSWKVTDGLDLKRARFVDIEGEIIYQYVEGRNQYPDKSLVALVDGPDQQIGPVTLVSAGECLSVLNEIEPERYIYFGSPTVHVRSNTVYASNGLSEVYVLGLDNCSLDTIRVEVPLRDVEFSFLRQWLDEIYIISFSSTREAAVITRLTTDRNGLPPN